MKTYTIEKKEIPHFDTLSEIFEAAKSNGSQHQVTGQELINGRTHVFGHWQEIHLSDELRQNICNDIAETLGGQSKTKAQIKNVLRFGRPQHWGLNRVFIEKYTGDAYLKYCAGQDQVWETREIRKALNR